MNYNEKYIDEYSEETYLKYLNNETLLKKLFANYQNRYNKEEKVSGELILFQESLNNYVIKSLKKNPNFSKTTYFENYKKYLQAGLKSNTKFFFHNNFFHSFNHSELQNYLGRDLYNQIDPSQDIKDVQVIYKKMSKGMTITQRELDMVCDINAFKRDIITDPNKVDYHRLLIEYIFNNLTKPDSRLVCSEFVLDAILAYMPKYYPSRDGFNPLGTRIVADDSRVKVGVSHGDSFVLMNRDLFKKTNFKSIDDITKTYVKEGSDFTFLLIVLNHEFSHQYQSYMEKQSEFSNEGYMAIKNHILNRELNDYGNNHDGDDIEIDATEKGWDVCRKFYKDFIHDENLKHILVDQSGKNERGTSNRRFTYMKVDKYGTKSFTPFYDFRNLTDIIYKKPEYIKKYPMLKTFYNENGQATLDFLKKENICKKSVGADYCTFMCINYPYMVLKYLKTLSSEAELKYAFDNITETFNNRKRVMLNFLQNKKEGLNSEHISVDQQMDCHYLLTKYQKTTSDLYSKFKFFCIDKSLIAMLPTIKDCQSLIDYYMDRSEVYYNENIKYLDNNLNNGHKK